MKSFTTYPLQSAQTRLSVSQLEQLGDAISDELGRDDAGLLGIGVRPFRLLALLLVTGCATDGTVTVTESVNVPAAPAKTWNTIKDFMHWQAWHPAFVSTDLVRGDGSHEGSVRLLTTRDGGKFTEELVAFDEAARSYSYRILESGAPVIDYVSTLAVEPSKLGSNVVWSSRFKVEPGTSDEDARKLISGVYRAGLDNLAAVVK
jgi:Polyketide cyclase / dehydrase and lipid transport